MRRGSVWLMVTMLALSQDASLVSSFSLRRDSRRGPVPPSDAGDAPPKPGHRASLWLDSRQGGPPSGGGQGPGGHPKPDHGAYLWIDSRQSGPPSGGGQGPGGHPKPDHGAQLWFDSRGGQGPPSGGGHGPGGSSGHGQEPGGHQNLAKIEQLFDTLQDIRSELVRYSVKHYFFQ